MAEPGSESRSRKTESVVLPDDACPRCGTAMREVVGELSHSVDGERVRVADLPHLRCPQCDEVVLLYDQARQLRERAIELYRRQHDLLSAVEIRSIRESSGLTQGAFARLLRLGANTLSRWETGRTVQTAALDVLLRLIRDLPGSLEYLRKHAA